MSVRGSMGDTNEETFCSVREGKGDLFFIYEASASHSNSLCDLGKAVIREPLVIF